MRVVVIGRVRSTPMEGSKSHPDFSTWYRILRQVKKQVPTVNRQLSTKTFAYSSELNKMGTKKRNTKTSSCSFL